MCKYNLNNSNKPKKISTLRLYHLDNNNTKINCSSSTIQPVDGTRPYLGIYQPSRDALFKQGGVSLSFVSLYFNVSDNDYAPDKMTSISALIIDSGMYSFYIH